MKAFIQYLNYRVLWKEGVEPGLIPACGDRSVVQLDGRRTLKQWIQDGIECNGYRRPVYPAFEIHKGDFRNSVILHKSY